jgi:hypothetical protein
VNRYVIEKSGRYRVWASDPDRRATRILVDGVPTTGSAESNLGPFGDATLHLELGLVQGAEITVAPENSRLIVYRASDGKGYTTAGSSPDFAGRWRPGLHGDASDFAAAKHGEASAEPTALVR